MEFLTDTFFTEFGRSDYIGGIDNEALDFGQLDQFIQVTTGGGGNAIPVTAGSPTTDSNGSIGGGGVVVASGTGGSIVGDGVTASDGNQTGAIQTSAALTISNATNTPTTQTHLPESPPDSGSEPPYSPSDLHSLTVTGTPVSTTIHQQSNQTPSEAGDIATLTDLSQSDSIDLHHSHLSLLNVHQHQLHLQHSKHHQNHQQQQHHATALYIRSDLVDSTELHLHQQPSIGIGELTLCKQEDMLLHQQHQPPELLLQQQQQQPALLDAYRPDLPPHHNLLGLTTTSLNADDLSRLMPNECYSPMATSTPSSVAATITVTRTGETQCQQQQQLTAISHGRKRKFSHSDLGGPPSLVKPEPNASLSPICQSQQQSHLESIDAAMVLPPACSLDSSTGTPTNVTAASIGEAAAAQNLDTNSGGGSISGSDTCPLQCIRFSPFQQQNWHILCNQSLQELPVPYYNVDADKGFNFSNSDDAFVCQKKNHFQITCHAKLHGNAAFVRTASGLEKIKSFHLHFYGVKLETPSHTIRIEQSQSDRSKKPFHPVPIDLQNGMVSKITVVRLHFSETTSNNMRKKGRPNPEQRYFQLVVGLHAHTHSGHFPVVSHGSERIIVRASNPGQFESDVELCWQRGVTQDSIYHAGRVGINTDRPDESLVVHGNLKVSGHIVQPSDSRAKQEIGELDTRKQLQNLQKIRIVRYRYEPEFAAHSGLKAERADGEIVDTGVIAQEVREILPDAVQEAGSIVLANGQVIENFLLVNKDRILMENIGAVKELCKVTGSLETRIEQLEKINTRLIRIQQLDRNHNCATQKCKHLLDDDDDIADEICSNKTIQKIIIILVAIMAICLLAISALYFMEHRQNYLSGGSMSIEEPIYGEKRHLPPERRSQSSPKQPTSVPPEDFSSYLNTEVPGDVGGGSDGGIKIIGQNSQLTPSSGKPKTMKIPSTATTLISNQLPGDDTTDNTIPIAPVLPFDGDHSAVKKPTVIKGKPKVVIGGNTKKPQYVPHQHIPVAAPVPPQPVPHSAKSASGVGHSGAGSDPQPIINGKNHAADGAEEQDLQYLSNSSDSDDQFQIIEATGGAGTSSSNTVAINTVNRTITTQIVGVPAHCETIKLGTVECQSLCCAETNILFDAIEFAELHLGGATAVATAAATVNRTLTTTNVVHRNPIRCRTTTSPVALSAESAALQPNTSNQKIAQQSVDPKQQQPHTTADIQDGGDAAAAAVEIAAAAEIFNDRSVSSESGVFVLPTGTKRKTDDKIIPNAAIGAVKGASGTVPDHHHRSRNCYPIQFVIRSESFNISVGKETLCLSNGPESKRHNVSYTIPISKYMRETKIELHFIGLNPLQWMLCNRKDSTMSSSQSASAVSSAPPSSLLPSSASPDNSNNIDDGILQINPSKSVFHLHLPSYGYFERRFELRAGFDLKQSSCQEHTTDDSSNLLQYNIRIFRDCD